jgi:excisionase family DNA binding protein
MQNTIPSDKLLSIGKSSEYLGVSIDTLRRWEKKGRITPLRSPGGHRYYSKDELDALFGKRYTRDEQTQRRTNEELGKPDTSQDIKTPPPAVIQTDKESMLNPPVAPIPPWRPVQTAPEENIPAPQIEIPDAKTPEANTLQTENTQKPAENTTPEPLIQNILTPQKKDDNTLSEEEIEKRIHSIIKSEKKGGRSQVALIILSSLFIIADIVLLIIWLTSSRIVSPIP